MAKTVTTRSLVARAAVPAETACETAHKSSPRKRRPAPLSGAGISRVQTAQFWLGDAGVAVTVGERPRLAQRPGGAGEPYGRGQRGPVLVRGRADCAAGDAHQRRGQDAPPNRRLTATARAQPSGAVPAGTRQVAAGRRARGRRGAARARWVPAQACRGHERGPDGGRTAAGARRPAVGTGATAAGPGRPGHGALARGTRPGARESERLPGTPAAPGPSPGTSPWRSPGRRERWPGAQLGRRGGQASRRSALRCAEGRPERSGSASMARPGNQPAGRPCSRAISGT